MNPMTPRRLQRLRITACLATLLCSVFGSAQSAESNGVIPEGFSFAAVGDIIYQRPALSVLEKGAAPVLKQLRSVDVSFGNFESSGFELKGFVGAPQSKIEGPTLLTPPAALTDLKSMGFDLLSHANNHVFDWGTQGVLASNRALRAAGLLYSGSGASLKAAREPAVFTARGVRVALLSATSSFPSASMAADSWGTIAARPGVNGINVQRIVTVSANDLQALRSVASHEPPAAVPSPPPAAGEVRLLGQTFKASGRNDERMGFSYRVDEKDRTALSDSIAAAKGSNTLVLYSLHTHEVGDEETAPPDFEIALARQAIDAGADAFLAHGAHQLRGIEIYKGKPIFYSLANFSIMLPPPEVNATPMVIPPNSLFTRRSFSESVVAVGRYRGGRLAEIELHPFELTSTNQLATHGVPQAVSPQAARVIIERLQQLSKPFGTAIAFENGVGVIRIK